jgi:hypothetical protein
MRISCPLTKGKTGGTLYEMVGGGWKKIKEIPEVAAVDVFEIGIPFADLKAGEKDEIDLFISVRKGEEEIERCPWRGHVTLTVPTADFEAMMWY